MKKIVKKKAPVKKTPAKKKAAAKAEKPAAAKAMAGKPIGVVTHFYGAIKVAIVKFSKPVKVGTEVVFRGANTDVTQKIASMQFDHQPIAVAKKGKEVGIKVSKRVHEGNEVYAVKK